MSTLLVEPATEIAARLRRRELSSREVTELLLEHIDRVNPAVNAVVELQSDAALRAADAADRAIAHATVLGPLHGVPMTVKDSLQAAGLRTTWGHPAFREHVADWDATVVQRLRAAGAGIIGKTNAAFMLADFGQTTNDLYGTTNNPFALDRSPGGSSGGGAAAVAAGLSFLDHGSDLVGSLRIPAAFCGVYALRPTAGTVPLAGLQPPGPPAAPSAMTYLSTIGPIARSPDDLRAALMATAGPENPAARAYHWRLAPPRHQHMADFRVGFVLDDTHNPVSPEVTTVLGALIDRLDQEGATLVEGWPDGIDPVGQAETFGFHVGLFFAHQDPTGQVPDPEQLVPQERARMTARAAWAEHFRNVDVFISPVAFTPAIEHDPRPFEQRRITTTGGVQHPYNNLPFWTAHAALAGLPAVVAPVGMTADRLPIGAQIVGPMDEDDTALTFAGLMADLTGGYHTPFIIAESMSPHPAAKQ